MSLQYSVFIDFVLPGPIFSLNLAGQPVVVLNDFETATELLGMLLSGPCSHLLTFRTDRRSASYSDRPRLIMSYEILSGGLNIVLMRYGDLFVNSRPLIYPLSETYCRWRRMRKIAHEAVSGSSVVTYQPLQERSSAMLVASILENPGQWNVHIERSIASTILAIIYDWPRDDPRTEAVIERVYDIAHRQASAAIPGNYLVEIFPSMIHLPEWLAKWKREGRAWFKKDSEMFVGMMKNVEDKIVRLSLIGCIFVVLTYFY